MIYGLIAVVAVLLAALWMRHREASAIAYSYTEFLLKTLRDKDAELARIQNFEPPPKTPQPPPAMSQAEVMRELAAPRDYTDDELEDKGLVRNGDGRVVEIDHPENLWDSPADFDEWVAFKRAKGLPPDADPREWQGRME